MSEGPLDHQNADPAGIWKGFWKDAQARGVKRCSLFVVPPFHSAVTDSVRQFWWGYHPDWVAQYTSVPPDFRDEVPDYVIDNGMPMLMADAVKLVPETDAKRTLQASFFNYHNEDGVSAPLYGPNGNNGFLIFSFGVVLESAEVPRAKEMIRLGNRAFFDFAIHQQHRDVAATPLSPRELEVVALSAKGQSNKELARTLGISPCSVDTYMRRIFAKLGVTDRAQAVLRCLSLGLVRL